MTFSNFHKGAKIEWRNASYTVAGFPDGQEGVEVNLVSAEGRYSTIRTEELAEAYAKGELRFAPDPFGYLQPSRRNALEIEFHSHPEEVQEETRRRLAYVKAFDEHPGLRKSKRDLYHLIEDVAARIPDPKAPSVRTLIRWLNFWHASGRNMRALVPQYHSRGHRQPRLHHLVSQALVEVIDDVYARHPGFEFKDVWVAMMKKVDELNETYNPSRPFTAPSRNTIARFIRERGAYLLTLWKHGKRAADESFHPTIKSPRITVPLQELVFDHHLLDILAYDPETDQVVGRPWLTLALDRCTRMAVGLHIGFEPPSAHTVCLCLYNAISMKSYIKDRFPHIKQPWPCYGIPRSIVVDNGREFHSKHLQDVCAELGIDVKYMRSRTPRDKGDIERFFGTLERAVIHKLPGTTFSDPKTRGDYQSEKEACKPLKEISDLIHKWIIDVYQWDEHRGIQDVPARLWNELTKQHPPRMPENVAKLNILKEMLVYRTIQERKGIEYQGLHWNSEALQMLRNDWHTEVKVKIDPTDLSSIRVYHPTDKDRVLVVPSADPEYTADLTLDQHNLIKAFKRHRIKGAIRLRDLIDAKSFIREEALKATGKRGRKLAQKVAKLAGPTPEAAPRQDAAIPQQFPPPVENVQEMVEATPQDAAPLALVFRD